MLHRSLQAVILTVLGAGLVVGSVGLLVNAGLALVVTVLPTVLQRDYDIHLSPGLTLWITSAVTLHAVGMVALYDRVWWWDQW